MPMDTIQCILSSVLPVETSAIDPHFTYFFVCCDILWFPTFIDTGVPVVIFPALSLGRSRMSTQPVFTVSPLLFTVLFLTSMFYSLRSLPTLSLPNLATAFILLMLLAVLSYLLALFISLPFLCISMASCFLSHCSHCSY